MIRKKIDAKGRIALGTSLMKQLGLKLGQEVDLDLIEDGRALRIGRGPAELGSGPERAADRFLDALAKALEGRMGVIQRRSEGGADESEEATNIATNGNQATNKRAEQATKATKNNQQKKDW